MKVAIVKLPAKQPGGLEKYAKRIAHAFMARGDDVTFVTCQKTLPFWPPFLKLEQFNRQVDTWIKSHSPDVVFSMERTRTQTHIRAGNGVHRAFLHSRLLSEGWLKYRTCHINPLHRKILELERSAFEARDLKKIFVNSRMVQEDILRHYSVDPAKIELVYNGVEWQELETPFLNWQTERDQFFRENHLNADDLHLLFIGNGYTRKGLKPLLQALSRWKYKDFYLSVVGKEKRIDHFQKMASQLKIAHRVRFFKEQKSIIPFYQMADTLIIPSFYDPFANVTLEALSLGLFVVSSKSNGAHEVLTKENGAVIEDLLSPESFLQALDQALLYKKTTKSATAIRSGVSSFDFSQQLTQLINACIK